jgi:N-acetylated-alpha-linked acidic dipeptidase
MSELAHDIKDPRDGKPLAENMRSRNLARRSVRGVGQSPPSDASADNPQGSPPDGKFHLTALGSGSDYTPFLQHMGIARPEPRIWRRGRRRLSFRLRRLLLVQPLRPILLSSTAKALSEVTSTALLRLADAPLLPFEFTRLAETLSRYVSEVEKLRTGDRPNLDEVKRGLEDLRKSAAAFETAYSQALPKLESAPVDKLRDVNAILFRTERSMTLPQGLPTATGTNTASMLPELTPAIR